MKKLLLIVMLTCTKIDSQEVKVHATVYNAVVAQTNIDPGHTAFMFKIDLSNPYKHRIVAVSRDLLKQFPNGTKVYISGIGKYNGIYTVRDKMNKRYTRRIDILVNLGMKWISIKNAKIRKL